MSNIIHVDFTRRSSAIPYCPSVPTKKKTRVRKLDKLKKLPLFTFQLLNSLVDGLINIFSKAEEKVEDLCYTGIYFWRSLTKEQKMNMYESFVFQH